MANLDSWAVDIADVGAVYPMQGSEFIMVVVAMVVWVIWHIVQIGSEQKQLKDEVKRFGSPEELSKHLDK